MLALKPSRRWPAFKQGEIVHVQNQSAQTENTRAIADAAQELYSRVAMRTDHFEKIRDSLETVNRAFNQTVGSYESRIRPAAERIQKLGGAMAGKELADVQPLDTTLRLPS